MTFIHTARIKTKEQSSFSRETKLFLTVEQQANNQIDKANKSGETEGMPGFVH